MKTRWVLVADSVTARIFQHEADGLREVHEMTHLASQEHNSDLIGNRPNQNQHGMEKDLKGNEPQSFREHESEKFAREIADHLHRMRSRNAFEELVLVADPRFLGQLRRTLTKTVQQLVIGTLDKRAVSMKPAEIESMITGA